MLLDSISAVTSGNTSNQGLSVNNKTIQLVGDSHTTERLNEAIEMLNFE